jgi:alcohol dehydrogenase (NADP+)
LPQVRPSRLSEEQHMSTTAAAYIPAADGVDPARVPQRTLYTGAQMPAIGLGTFGSDTHRARRWLRRSKGAAAVGYRHFDCAAVYGNEH